MSHDIYARIREAVVAALRDAVPELPGLSRLTGAAKGALILPLWQRLATAERRIADVETSLADPTKTQANRSLRRQRARRPTRLSGQTFS